MIQAFIDFCTEITTDKIDTQISNVNLKNLETILCIKNVVDPIPSVNPDFLRVYGHPLDPKV